MLESKVILSPEKKLYSTTTTTTTNALNDVESVVPVQNQNEIPQIPPPKSSKAVAIWLYICAGLVFIMVVVGGVTRLTGKKQNHRYTFRSLIINNIMILYF